MLWRSVTNEGPGRTIESLDWRNHFSVRVVVVILIHAFVDSGAAGWSVTMFEADFLQSLVKERLRLQA